MRKVRVIINPKSGLIWNSDATRKALGEVWDVPGIDLTYQFSQNADDGKAKASRAVEEGADTILVVGGDGMVHTVGSCLVGTDVALGVIPAGSGNGFARHFNIPLEADRAALALMDATPQKIDVGTAHGIPFFVTCSMAWDAALVRSYEKSPVRGVLPYVFAGAYEFLDYRPQPIEVMIDGKQDVRFENPVVFTVANLTQFGGGAKIAPRARPDDGKLELVVIGRQHVAWCIANVHRLFDGTIDDLKHVYTREFTKMEVRRVKDAQIQMDGELVDVPKDFSVDVLEQALTVLVPESVP